MPISTAGLALERAVSKRVRLSRHAAARDSSGGRLRKYQLVDRVQTLAHGRDETERVLVLELPLNGVVVQLRHEILGG